jgi:hypothetical protein
MSPQETAKLVFERAWSTYRMLHSDVHEDDERRCTLERYLQQQVQSGEQDLDILLTGGLRHLQKLGSTGDFECY